jgi:3-phosphoshikimate 1-carboxyvinyltransferase
VSSFAFVGKIPASKSMLIRALLIQSYFPNMVIEGDSNCDDVEDMREALAALEQGREIPVGAAGTVLRFMALKASRKPGTHVLKGDRRLFERPQQELTRILKQLGVESRLGEDFLEVKSNGWKLHGDTVAVPSDRSSQFASSLLLNAWDLPFDLYVSQGGRKVSEGYWRMSVRMAQAQGMRMDFWDSDFRIPREQKAHGEKVHVEPDMSSAFAIAAIAAVSGRATLLDFPAPSLQPDAVFTQILKTMDVPIHLSGTALKVERAQKLNGISVNLGSAPDLFPVLAALCALAHGESDLFGAPQLVHKESNRLKAMADAIEKLGRKTELKDDGLKILGEPPKPGAAFDFDTDQDHRLAFAGAVWKAAGFPVTILNPEAVNKSFPEFWSFLGWTM